MNIKVDL